jgi:hypothetical protein
VAVILVAVSTAGAETSTVPLYKKFEVIIVNARSYSDPLRQVTLNAAFRSPSGKEILFWGFFDGDGIGGQTGNVWKLRFMPTEIGSWTYTYTWSDGSTGGSGSFLCVEAGAGKGVLQPYGPNPHWLAYNGVEPVMLNSYYAGVTSPAQGDFISV